MLRSSSAVKKRYGGISTSVTERPSHTPGLYRADCETNRVTRIRDEKCPKKKPTDTNDPMVIGGAGGIQEDSHSGVHKNPVQYGASWGTNKVTERQMWRGH
ncbi:hypothetical protein QAD02_008103 [Eretmocerus hayati]|uniref:Uncharacterized protein n=1 Tax=Eretmocerus hayati TaxID=131215 RepID=A0ACC2N5T8_9HYME|nr:hypothetical protein QAD02_008103 [Eretmocerus hayati]